MTGANLTFILTSIITCDNFIKFGGCVYWRQKCLCVFLNAAFEPNINRALRVPDGWGTGALVLFEWELHILGAISASKCLLFHL